MKKLTKIQKQLFKQLRNSDEEAWNGCDPDWIIRYLNKNRDLWERGWFAENTLSLIPSKTIDERFFNFFIQSFHADEMDVFSINDCLAHSNSGYLFAMKNSYERMNDECTPTIRKILQDNYNDMAETLKKNRITLKFLKESGSKIGGRIWWD